MSTGYRIVGGLAAAVAAALALSGCGGSKAASGATEVDAASVGQLGTVLTTAGGKTLYMFPPDDDTRVSCTGECAVMWTPLTAAGHHAPTAGNGVAQSMLGTDPNPAGGAPVVTYDGWPLYTYIDDVKPGEARGQAFLSFGGYWYAMSPDGVPDIAP